MFIKIGNITQHVSDISGIALLFGVGNEATPMEAAECINRYIINGDERMHEANEEFKRVYGKMTTAVATGMSCQILEM